MMLTPEWVLRFVITSLAVYRASYAITIEHGPANIFDITRSHFKPTSLIGGVLRCPHCLSVWIGFVAALFLMDESVTVSWWIAVSLALSAVASILVKRYG